MTKYINRIHDIATGEITEVEYTKEQTAAVEAELAKSKAIEAAQEKTETDKAALLAKLGITADEAKLLLQ
jgi:hypothetical protein